MVEFLVGLVGVVFLVLGLHQIMQIVVFDLDSLIGSRDEVAEALTTGSGGTSYDASGAYSPDAGFYNLLRGSLAYDNEYAYYFDNYKETPSVDGFETLDGNPLEGVVGAEGGHTIPVESPLMRQLLGSGIRIENSVWMPVWDDLMY